MAIPIDDKLYNIRSSFVINEKFLVLSKDEIDKEIMKLEEVLLRKNQKEIVEFLNSFIKKEWFSKDFFKDSSIENSRIYDEVIALKEAIQKLEIIKEAQIKLNKNI